MALLSFAPKLQFFNAAGAPLVGGKLYSYAAGTTTPLATYTDESGTTPNSNPIVLDSRGEASVWLAAAFYKLKLTDANDVEIWTVDSIEGDYASITAQINQLSSSSGASMIGFVQANTFAVARTVQDKLREYVSVKDYGAVGDGIADDTAAIQSAIDNNANKTIYFPFGTYKCTSTIILTDASGHNFQGNLLGDNATVNFVTPGNAAAADSDMAHGFRAYPTINGPGGDISGLQQMYMKGFTVNGPANGASIYWANTSACIFEDNRVENNRYGLCLESCINIRISSNTFINSKNAGLGMIKSNNPNVYYPDGAWYNDSPYIVNNRFLSDAQNQPLAFILDHGSQSLSTRIIEGNLFFGNRQGSTNLSTQYGYLGRTGEVTFNRNWTENVNYPVRILNGNAFEPALVPSVIGAQPNGTYAVNNFPNGFSYSGFFKGNQFARSFQSLNLSGINYNCEVGQNISAFLENGGTHILSTQAGDQNIMDFGDNLIAPVGTYAYKGLAGLTYTAMFQTLEQYTPTVTSTVGTLTSYTVNNAKWVQLRRNLVGLWLDVTITDAGTGSGAINILMPPSGYFTAPANAGVIPGVETVTSKALSGAVNASLCTVRFYDGTFPGATGNRLVLSGIYAVT